MSTNLHGGPSGGQISSPTTIQATSTTAFVVEKADATVVFKVDTSTPAITGVAPTYTFGNGTGSMALNIGSGGSAASITTQIIINTPDTGTNASGAQIQFRRNGGTSWTTGIDGTASGAKGSVTDFFLNYGGTNVAALSTAGALKAQSTVTANNGTSTTAGGADGLIMGASAAMKILWGSGAPTASAPQGSLYLRTDGSSTSTRAYINTDGSTTWTALTTAA